MILVIIESLTRDQDNLLQSLMVPWKVTTLTPTMWIDIKLGDATEYANCIKEKPLFDIILSNETHV